MRSKLVGVAFVLLGAALMSAQSLPTATKTVSATGAPCNATSSIEVVPGTSVSYCYQIFNPFNDTLTYALVDDHLGSIDNSSVPPFEFGQDIASTVVNGSVTNIATWFWSVSPTNATTISGNVSASATVTVPSLVPVPTLSDLGLIALGMGILAVAVHFLRRAG